MERLTSSLTDVNKTNDMESSMVCVLLQRYMMTESNFKDPIHHRVGARNLKKTIRIDMTPMVDLGFLLIAFFIFTTEISKPVITTLWMPHDAPDSTYVSELKSLTFLLGDHDDIFYYYGNQADALRNKHIYQTTYDGVTGIRACIMQKQSELEIRGINRKELVVLIKPCKDCCYENVVNALDEMLITGVTQYAIMDPGNDESAFLSGAK